MKEVWSQPTADKTILTIPTKQKNLEMKWNEMKWALLPIETVYTLIYQFVQKSVSALF